MNKRRKLIGVSLGIAIVYFIISFLVEAAKWFQTRWDSSISFATVVYQLSTPLKGTNSEIIVDFCKVVLPASLVRGIGVAFFYYLFERIFTELQFQICIQTKTRNWLFKTGKKFYFNGKILFWLVLIGSSIGTIGYKVKELGIFDYIADIHKKSTIFDDFYISPDAIEITFPNEKRNMIFIFLESMETTYISVEDGGGKSVNYIPELTVLAQNNINISNTDKIGGAYQCSLTGWTIAAILGGTSGVPYKIPGDGNDGDKYEKFLPGLVTLGDILSEQGYHNYFLCGSDAEFAGRDIYFRAHGSYDIEDYFYAIENGFLSQDYFVSWGYEDMWLFEIAKRELSRIAAEQNAFNFTMLTVDTHHPEGYSCSLCEEQYEYPYANVLACSSRQIVEFVQWIQLQEWYENTTIILYGDHNSMVRDFWEDIGDYSRRTYNCFINLPENINISNIKDREFTILDMFPTTLSALGVEIEGERLGLGTNLFSDKKTLSEELGVEYFDRELSKHSQYYYENFVKSKGN